MYAVSGIMQAILLFMCIAWKVRQRRLHIDDFGHPLPTDDEITSPVLHTGYTDVSAQDGITQSEHQDDSSTQVPVPDIEIVRAMLGEDTPLLKNGKRRDSLGKKKGWLSLFRR